MQRLRKLPWLLLLLSGTLAAQPRGQSKGSPPDSSQARAQLDELSKDVRAHASHVAILRESARKLQDVIKMNCVNDVLIQLKAQQNLFDLNKMTAERAADDGRLTTAQFAAATDTATDIRRLRDEADACLGVGELKKDSENFTVGPDIVDDPTSDDPLDNVDVEPPAYASPYR